jgi:hypothetical protein
MEFYKILRIKQGKQFTISDTGLKLMKTEPDFESEYTVIGQCDVNGNLIEAIKAANFSPKVDESKIPPIFEDKNHGKKESGSGTGKPAASKSTGNKSGKSKSGTTEAGGADKENGNFGN